MAMEMAVDAAVEVAEQPAITESNGREDGEDRLAAHSHRIKRARGW